MSQLSDGLGLEIVSVTSTTAQRIAQAYERSAKGTHPAALNFGDCFAYEFAELNACPLLYVGEDFRQTDVEAALD